MEYLAREIHRQPTKMTQWSDDELKYMDVFIIFCIFVLDLFMMHSLVWIAKMNGRCVC